MAACSSTDFTAKAIGLQSGGDTKAHASSSSGDGSKPSDESEGIEGYLTSADDITIKQTTDASGAADLHVDGPAHSAPLASGAPAPMGLYWVERVELCKADAGPAGPAHVTATQVATVSPGPDGAFSFTQPFDPADAKATRLLVLAALPGDGGFTLSPALDKHASAVSSTLAADSKVVVLARGADGLGCKTTGGQGADIVPPGEGRGAAFRLNLDASHFTGADRVVVRRFVGPYVPAGSGCTDGTLVVDRKPTGEATLAIDDRAPTGATTLLSYLVCTATGGGDLQVADAITVETAASK